MSMHHALVAIVCLIALPAHAAAQGPPSESENTRHFNLRVGAATTDSNERASICLEVNAWRKLSIEGCGTGSGVLHSDDGGEMAHFRAKWAVWKLPMPSGSMTLQTGLGFAELEVGVDEPGFNFGSPTGNSAAGAEGALSLQYLAPLGRGFELIANSTIGMAYISGANELPGSPSQTQPFATFELGVGW